MEMCWDMSSGSNPSLTQEHVLQFTLKGVCKGTCNTIWTAQIRQNFWWVFYHIFKKMVKLTFFKFCIFRRNIQWLPVHEQCYRGRGHLRDHRRLCRSHVEVQLDRGRSRKNWPARRSSGTSGSTQGKGSLINDVTQARKEGLSNGVTLIFTREIIFLYLRSHRCCLILNGSNHPPPPGCSI